MAVTLTVAQLAVELRLITAETDTIPTGQSAVLTRALAAATAAVQEYAPDAPEALQNEAAVRLASRLFDQAGSESRGGNPFVASGAAALLSRHRLRSVKGPSGTAPAASGGTDEDRVNELIVAALAAYEPVDATARSDADSAQAAADAAQVRADGAFTLAGIATTPAEAAALVDMRVSSAAAGRIPTAPGSVNSKVWKTGPAGEAPDWRDDDTTAGSGSHNDATARAQAAQAKAEADSALTHANNAAAKATANSTRLNAADFVIDRFSVAMKALRDWGFGAFANANVEATAAGFGIGYWVSGEEPSAYGDVTWNTEHADLPASTSYFVALRVPSGYPVDADWIRVVPSRGGADGGSEPGGNRHWRPFPLTDTPGHYDTYALFSNPTTFIGIELQANDDIRMQLALPTSFQDAGAGLARTAIAAAAANTRRLSAVTTTPAATVRELQASDDLRIGTLPGTGRNLASTPHTAVPFAAYNFGTTTDVGTTTGHVGLYVAYDPDNVDLAQWEVYGSTILFGGFAYHAADFSHVVSDITEGVPAGWVVRGLPGNTTIYPGIGNTLRARGHPLVPTWAGALKAGIVSLDDLAAAVLARMAPALTGNGGKFLAVNSGATAVELVDAPEAGGGVTLAQVATKRWSESGAFSSTKVTQSSSYTIPAGRILQFRTRGVPSSDPGVQWKSPLILSDRLLSLPVQAAGATTLNRAKSYESAPIARYSSASIRLGRDASNVLLVSFSTTRSQELRFDVLELS